MLFPSPSGTTHDSEPSTSYVVASNSMIAANDIEEIKLQEIV